MKAIVWTAYGPPEVLQLQEVETPTPREGEVLIRIHATTVTAGDCELRALSLPLHFSLPMRLWLGFRKPRPGTIPGTDLAGEIEAVGKAVRLFKAGDRVFGSTGLGLGAYAEYKCLPEEPEEGVLATAPANSTYEQAAAVPLGGLEALHFLAQAQIRPGQTVLINGAGGSIGTFAVQLARHWGAEVTAVDGTGKLDMLRSIGAGKVIDYTREDFAENGETYDVIFDVVGTTSFSRCERSLKPNGCYLVANPRLSQLLRGRRTVHGKKVIVGTSKYRHQDLVFLRELIEAGQIRSVIDRRYPLEQIAAAHRYVETGQKTGNVVIILP